MARVTDPIAARLAGLRQEMARRKVQAMLITSPIDVGYLSGFTGDDSWLLVGAGRPWLITDFRYIEQARKECPRVGRVLRKGAMTEALRDLVARRPIESLGFDPDTMTVMERSRFRLRLKAQLVPMAGAVGALRIRKDATELRAIRGGPECGRGGVVGVPQAHPHRHDRAAAGGGTRPPNAAGRGRRAGVSDDLRGRRLGIDAARAAGGAALEARLGAADGFRRHPRRIRVRLDAGSLGR